MATLAEAFDFARQCHRGGDFRRAEHIYRQILQVQPGHMDSWFYLGTSCQAQGKFADAADAFRRCIEFNPQAAAAYNNLGVALAQQKKHEEAVACYREALRLDPRDIDAYTNLGNDLLTLGRPAEAVECLQQAIQMQPNAAGAYQNLGNAFAELDRLDDAIASLRHAIQLAPHSIDARLSLGNTLCKQRKFDDARAVFEEARQLNPDYAETHWNQALAFLLMGDYERGWEEYEWRWKCKEFTPFQKKFPQPIWDGSALSGRTILIHVEQGMGDIFQFIRYVPVVKRVGGTVILMAGEILAPLLSRCPGVDRLIFPKEALPPFDVHAPLLSLPAILKTTVATVPAEVPYLFADPTLVEQWRQELSSLQALKIGIAWKGSPKYQRDRHRSIPLSYFEPVARLDGVRLISLQKGPGVEQIAEVADRFEVLDLSDRLDEKTGAFMDTAAVIRNLDLVIAADTAIVHLAGALEARVWVAMPSHPDWRWLMDRDDSPWYPQARLFRQKEYGNWTELFERVTAGVKAMMAGK